MLDNDLDTHIRKDGGVVVGAQTDKKSDGEALEA